MTIRAPKDFWAGVMFCGFAAIGILAARGYSLGSAGKMGPGYFPSVLSGLLMLFGAAAIIRSFVSKNPEEVGAFAWKPLFIILGAVLLFGFMLPRVGMVISLPILVLISAYASDEHTWVGTIVNATILTVMSWLVFVVGLKLTIPMWPAFLG